MLEKLERLLEEKGYFSVTNDLERIRLIQEVFAARYPFENLDVLLEIEDSITPEYVVEKMLESGRGGVCYELNALLLTVLKELGFDITPACATVWSDPDQDWIIDRTHSINLLKKEGKVYLIDAGSGNNLTCQPVELDGGSVSSPAGRFRLITKETERGTVALEVQSGEEWKLRYAFFMEPVSWDDYNRVKKMIHHHPESPFNKTLLVAQTLEDGIISLNEERLRRKWTSGKEQRIVFSSPQEMLEAVKHHFHVSIYEAAAQYVEKNLEKLKS
ncbi:arylamine N-acetyltransferase [Siminovitchia acidinfaciens]|uniref:Arylamine N-acetyltransferase n=1 Tax=Siminovitchia acidinfaciens TaxID=2321395 RepID=A0A429XT44_9BACI|nr:arylamine N-acetyltransferase [Siminovitchia acidinfaciens]RST70860.1 arylamine N-acetyltransferase [Siminovitchia acidinfaciens]